MIIENPEVFRSWLATVLEPLCDADPVTLAKYVYALVKKDKPVNDLRQSMILQLDVFLHQETESFVALLFKTIENKEYLNAKKDVKDDKKPEELKQVVQPAQSSETGKEKEKEKEKEKDKVAPEDPEKDKERDKDKDKDNEDIISSTDEKQNGVQIQSSVVSEGTTKPSDSEVKLNDGKEERRKENERDDRGRANRSRLKKENSLPRNQRSRSRSWDRLRRSRSRDRDRDRGDRLRERDRVRLYRNKSPPRRYDRGFDRRRTYSRSPSPGRYRAAASRSKSRSPKVSHRGRFRNRSPPLSHSRSPRSRSRSRSRSFDRKNSPNARDGTPTQDSNHGDGEMRLPQPPHSVNDNETDRHHPNDRRCRNYDEVGYCMRGDFCPYDHGKDPVVLEDVALSQVFSLGPQGPPNLSLAPPGMPRPVHDIVPPMGMPPGLPPPPGVGLPMCPPPHMMMQAPPPLVMRPPPNMEYSPDAPAMNPGMNWGRPAFRGPPRPMHPHQPGLGFNQGQRELINVPVESHSHSFHMQNQIAASENHGHMDLRKNNFDSNRQFSNCCLVLKKVPPGMNSITHLNNHFSKFGKIVNIQVNYENDPESATVTFSSPAEANAAIKSTEAVLNNRFIKVFWHNSNKDGSKQASGSVKDRLGASPQSTSVASTPVSTSSPVTSSVSALKKTNLTSIDMLKKDNNKTQLLEDKKAKKLAALKKSQEILEKDKLLKKKKEETRKEALKLTSDLRKRSQILLEKQIEEQKALIKKLELGNIDEKQKKDIKETIKILQESIEKINKKLVVPTKVVKKVAPVRKTKEEIQKEILDAELDLITKQQEGGDISILQKKIALLKLELTKLQPAKLLGPRGIPRCPLKTSLVKNVMSVNRTLTTKSNHLSKAAVDHRPTKLLVSGYENDEKDMVLTHFRQFGEIGDYISDDSTPSIVLNFKTRPEAELAMAKGKSFQDRLLTVTWFSNANIQSKRRNSSVSGPTYHMHAGRQVLLSGSETDADQDSTLENDESEIDHGLESSEDLLLQDDDEDLEDEERSWRR